MPIQNDDVSVSDFISVTANGLHKASFTEIRAAIISRYQDAYGTDIDLSTGSADGVFVNDLALIINNILRVMCDYATNLDINAANGAYLDSLCALNNVFRRAATYSNTTLQVTNTQAETATFTDLQFVDKSGNTWIAEGELQFAANETKTVYVRSTVAGPIAAPVGWIYQTVPITYLTVAQANEANVGSDAESDAQLRERRLNSSAAAGVTTLTALDGALRDISGIEDVKIYNNNSDSAISADDGTSVSAHSIYVILKQQDGVTIEDELIGSTIHDKLTPGIPTCESSGTAGTSKSYLPQQTFYNTAIAETDATVYWKKATGQHTSFTMNLHIVTYQAQQLLNSTVLNNIGQAVLDYLTSLPVGQNAPIENMKSAALSASPLLNGWYPFTPEINLGFGVTSLASNDAYFDYNKFTISDGVDIDKMITFSKE